MEITTEPDTYMPSIDEIGNYVDKIPPFNTIKGGLRCPCGCRKDKVYETYTVFANHIKTKSHQKWLANLNLNKANYYVENESLKETIQSQRLIIAKLEKDLHTKSMTIDYLTQHINTFASPSVVRDLIDFD